MRPGGGKAKGSSFEREIARILSLWWSNQERDDIFGRTMSSGAWGTQRAKSGKRTFGQYGDLQALDPIGQPFISMCCAELKVGYGSWDVLDALDRLTKTKPQTFELFLKQVVEETSKSDSKYPILIFKRDRKETMLTMPLALFTHIVDVCGNPDKSMKGMRVLLPEFDYSWFVIRLDEFTSWVTPEAFKDIKPKLKLKLKLKSKGE
jgi:hypothetical protein